MNQGKSDMVKWNMERTNINLLGNSELKWMGMGKFNLDDHFISYCGQESLRRNGVALIVNKRVWNAVLWCNLKNDRGLSPNRWCQRSWSLTVLGRPTLSSRTNTKRRCPFHHRGLESKSRKSRDTQNNKQVWPCSTEWSRVKANSFIRKHDHSKHPFPAT